MKMNGNAGDGAYADTTPVVRPVRRRRAAALALGVSALLALGSLFWLGPIPQEARYHAFADARTLLGLRHAVNVLSNLPFLAVGAAGLALCLSPRRSGAWTAWAVFFGGVTLVCFGSGYYHAAPTNAALVWDRLPMTVAFMGLFTALVSEHGRASWERYLLLPAVAAGLASVGWWHTTDDLRFYVAVQGLPLLAIPLVLLLFPARYRRRAYLLYGLGFYAAAKAAELYDREIYALTAQLVSGHSLKHLLAAGGAFCVYLMLRRRAPAAAPR